MPLTVEGWRAEQEEAPNEWLLLVPKPKMGPTKKGSWSGWGTSLLLESCNKNDGLGAPLLTTAMVQEPEQFTPHHIVHKWMDWFYFRKVNALTKLGAMLAWNSKHGCDIPGLVFLQRHRPLILLASWRCTLPLITGLSHNGKSQKYQEVSAALLEVSISLSHPGQSTSLFKLLLQATEFPSKQSSIFFCFRVLH